jgi:hypothetical protein
MERGLPVAAGINNDLHAYDPDSMTWYDLSTCAFGTPPSARWGHGFASVGGKLYVHGGINDVFGKKK